MAGGVLKGFGGVLLALGIVLFLVGAAAAAYGAIDQRANEEDSGPFGVGEDRERSEQNEGLLAAGIAAAGLGFLLTVVGILLLAAGGARARRAELRALAASRAAATTAPVASAPGAAGAVTDAATAPGPPSARHAASSSPRAVPAPGPSSGRRAVLLTLVLIAVVVSFTLVGLVANDDGEGGLFGADDNAANTNFLHEERLDGQLGQSVTLLGMTQGAGASATLALGVPDEADRVVVQLNWSAGAGGVDRLDARLEVEANGSWQLLARQAGGPGLTLDVADGRIDELAVRLVVAPGTTGATSGQAFTVDVRYFR